MKSFKPKSAWAFGNSGLTDKDTPTPTGMGDYYGTGIRNPIGKLRGETVGYRPATEKQLRIPPTSTV